MQNNQGACFVAECRAAGQRLRPSGYRGPKCPRCGCIDSQVLGSNGKPLSAGKAVVGHMVAGPAGMFVGAAMGKRGKYEVFRLKFRKRFRFK